MGNVDSTIHNRFRYAKKFIESYFHYMTINVVFRQHRFLNNCSISASVRPLDMLITFYQHHFQETSVLSG